MITDKQSIANIFNKHFVNVTSDIEEPKSNCNANFEDHPSISAVLESLPDSASSKFDFTLCNTVIVEKCLHEIRMNKSSGYDGIIYHGFSRTRLPSYLVHYVPSSIHQLLQVIIQTTGRRVKLHRFLKKTTSSLKHSHFNGILADNLSAYRKHHSCQTALLRLVEDWKDCLDKDLMVAVISMISRKPLTAYRTTSC